MLMNGPTGFDDPRRQDLDSAPSDGCKPLNVLGGNPTTKLDYSPMWRLLPAKWTLAAKALRIKRSEPRPACRALSSG